jgi:hypothetical protein
MVFHHERLLRPVWLSHPEAIMTSEIFGLQLASSLSQVPVAPKLLYIHRYCLLKS